MNRRRKVVVRMAWKVDKRAGYDDDAYIQSNITVLPAPGRSYGTLRDRLLKSVRRRATGMLEVSEDNGMLMLTGSEDPTETDWAGAELQGVLALIVHDIHTIGVLDGWAAVERPYHDDDHDYWYGPTVVVRVQGNVVKDPVPLVRYGNEPTTRTRGTARPLYGFILQDGTPGLAEASGDIAKLGRPTPEHAHPEWVRPYGR